MNKILGPFLYSFGSRTFYREVANNWTGVGFCFLHLILLVVLTNIPTALQMHFAMRGFAEKDLPDVIAQIPTVTVAGGEASMDRESPYEIVGKTGEVLAIFDMRPESAAMSEGKAPLIVTRKRLLVRSEQQTRVVEMDAIGDITVDRQRVEGWVSWGRRLLPLAFFLLLTGLFYAGRIIQVLIYAALGVLYSNLRKIPLPFDALMRLATLAITPVVLVNTALAAFRVTPPFWTILSIAASLAYLNFGISAARREPEIS